MAIFLMVSGYNLISLREADLQGIPIVSPREGCVRFGNTVEIGDLIISAPGSKTVN